MGGPIAHDPTLEAEPGDRVAPAKPFTPGFTIGHFQIVRELGAGGMGVVFEAYDPDLDRRVAIKVVRDRAASSAAGTRLLREAQAMARLAHPHVVAVHEVGTIEGQVFLVMELVPGATLSAWLDKPRSWREIVGAFVQAGEGLAAAHHAGLVHRDFKPTNVLVDPSGRVRVLDFGLADVEEQTVAAGSERVVAGTPGYMAPEQRVGDPVDARADQYAFGVSLQEALRKTPKVPRRVRAVIVRALEMDPEDRFRRMDDLLDELRAALSHRRRWLIALAATAMVSSAAASSVVMLSRPVADTCGVDLVESVWAGRGSLPAAFDANPKNAATAAKIVDDWAAGWKLGRAAACKADARAARVACLDRDLAELRAQVAIWKDGDRDVVTHAVAAALELPDPATCAGRTQLPLSSATIVARMAELAALQHSGESKKAGALVAGVVADAEASHDPTTIAAALLAAGHVQRDNGDLTAARASLSRAAEEAGRGGDDDLLARALTTEAIVAGDESQPLVGLGLADAARAIAARTSSHSEMISLVHGESLRDAGRLPEAIAELTDVVHRLEARHDPAARIELAAAYGGLASAYEIQQQYAPAIDLHHRAIAIEEADLGPDHPELAKTLHDLGNDELHAADFAGATAHYQRAHDIFVAAYGPHHKLAVECDFSLASVALDQNQDDEAERRYQHVLEEMDEFPADHEVRAAVEMALGSIARDRDRCQEALPHYEKSIAIYEHIGRTGAELGLGLVNLGACYAEVGRDGDATTALARAEKLLAEAQVPDLSRTELWALQADIALREGHRDRAIELCKRVLALLPDTEPWEPLRNSTREILKKSTR
jgi:tetratricopeptide (TPR) repeat protein